MQLLKDLEDNEDDEEMAPGEILRYQDPLDGMKTGLIVAILNGQQEVVWLLLWLTSGLHTQAFPEEVSRVAQVMGADRATASGVDIRTLSDEQSRTAEDLARSMGDTWGVLLGEGLLRA